MKVILSGRGSGKTKLLLEAINNLRLQHKRPLVVVANNNSRINLCNYAYQLGFTLSLEDIITADIFIEDMFDDSKYDEVFIDDTERMFEEITELPINTIVINEEK